MDDKTIVFKITSSDKYHHSCYISAIDDRGKDCEYITEILDNGHSHYIDLFEDMLAITDEFNKKGFSVKFEVSML